MAALGSDHQVYIEKVKEFLPVQRVLQGIADAVGDKFVEMNSLKEALAFNPLAESNLITLKESDLS